MDQSPKLHLPERPDVPGSAALEQRGERLRDELRYRRDADAIADAETDADSHTDAETHADSDTDAETHADANAGTDSDTDPCSDSDPDSHAAAVSVVGMVVLVVLTGRPPAS